MHPENPMNTQHQLHLQTFLWQRHFLACKKLVFLLKANTEAAMVPFRGGKVFAFTSLFERWFLSTDSQAGLFLPRWNRGSDDPSYSGIEVIEPLNTDFDKTIKTKLLENVA
jgi:hypothetical protein